MAEVVGASVFPEHVVAPIRQMLRNSRFVMGRVSEVDFEKGKITVEVLVPVEEVAPKQKIDKAADLSPEQAEKVKQLAEKKIADQTKKVLSEKDEDKAEFARRREENERSAREKTAKNAAKRRRKKTAGSTSAAAAPPALEGELTPEEAALLQRETARLAENREEEALEE